MIFYSLPVRWRSLRFPTAVCPRARDYVIAERKGSERDRCVEFMKAAVSAGSTTGLQTLFNPLVTGFVESRPSRAR
jgi:hypothetical protein